MHGDITIHYTGVHTSSNDLVSYSATRDSYIVSPHSHPLLNKYSYRNDKVNKLFAPLGAESGKVVVSLLFSFLP